MEEYNDSKFALQISIDTVLCQNLVCSVLVFWLEDSWSVQDYNQTSTTNAQCLHPWPHWSWICRDVLCLMAFCLCYIVVGKGLIHFFTIMCVHHLFYFFLKFCLLLTMFLIPCRGGVNNMLLILCLLLLHTFTFVPSFKFIKLWNVTFLSFLCNQPQLQRMSIHLPPWQYILHNPMTMINFHTNSQKKDFTSDAATEAL